MIEPPVNKAGTILDQHVFRPDKLILTNGISKKVIKFGWDLQGTGGSIEITAKKKA
jgi:hypothetical protein